MTDAATEVVSMVMASNEAVRVHENRRPPVSDVTNMTSQQAAADEARACA